MIDTSLLRVLQTRLGLYHSQEVAGPPQTLGGSVIDLAAEFAATDRNQDGRRTAAELGVKDKAFRRLDRNGNGDISKGEYLDAFTRTNSFGRLDRDGDGQLSGAEMAGLRRFDSRNYDASGDGRVSRDEFVVSRRAELQANKRARIEARLAASPGSYGASHDLNRDGRVTADEVMVSLTAARQAREAERVRRQFKALTGGRDALSTQDGPGALYQPYDADQDGRVTADEYTAGRQADQAAVGRARLLGERHAEAEKRLAPPQDGPPRPAPAPSTPASPGAVNLDDVGNLTWQQAVDLVRAKGGELFQHGKPTVLAIRTANAGTKSYDDHFVVLKPNGDMKAFAATTRPGFTTPGGGWNPVMVVPGNYEITPRWRDEKWHDAWLVNDAHGNMSVRCVKDSNGDGRYTGSELTQTVGCDQIRLHRGNASTTSSAGCFNVQDYDAFVAYMGGRDVSFDLTLVEA